MKEKIIRFFTRKKQHNAKKPKYTVGEKALRVLEKILGSGFYRSGKAASEIEILYPGRMGQIKLREHYAGKLQKSLLIFAVGIVISLVMVLTSEMQIQGGNELKRSGYGEAPAEYDIVMENSKGKGKDVHIEVSSKVYNDAQARELIRSAIAGMDETILGKNESPDRVYYDLELPGSIGEGLISIEWDVDNYDVMNDSGEICADEIDESGSRVELTGTFKYNEIKQVYRKTITVYPVPLNEEDRLTLSINKALKKADSENPDQNTMILPKTINGEKVTWKDKKSYTFLLMLLIGCVAAVVVFYYEDQKLGASLKKRQREMETDYSEILNKLVLLLGAGMTVRAAWERIALDYRKYGKRKRFAYEEMLLSLNEMKNGTAEATVYEHFGIRCGGTSYLKLSATLTQNLKKGSKGLLELFSREAAEANELRKNHIRKKGEEAGTKLLIPMIMMLGVVLVIVMVPAFQSMNI